MQYYIFIISPVLGNGAQGFFVILKLMSKQKSVVIIDGSNFYYKLKELKLRRLSSFNYTKFCLFISKNTQLIQKYYCIGKIRAKQNDVKARRMMAKQQSFITRLKKEGFIIQFGYLLKSDSHYHEKGVDVQIATDILKGAFQNLYDICYLVSSDSDLIPSIIEAQSNKKTIVYVGFRHQPSFSLLKTCGRSILLKKDELQLFC